MCDICKLEEQGKKMNNKIYIATNNGSPIAAFTNEKNALEKCLILAKEHSEKQKQLSCDENNVYGVQEINNGYRVFLSHYTVSSIQLN